MEWISVKDKLPEDDFECLFYVVSQPTITAMHWGFTEPHSYIVSGCYKEDYKEFTNEDMGSWKLDEVTRWKPLPNPPKEK